MAGGPTPFTNAFDHAQLDSLRYNASQAGAPIPIVYGTQRLGTNLIDGYGFDGRSAKGGKGGGGGGGGGSGGKKGGNKQYHAFVDWAICQGPVSFQGSNYGIGGENLVWSNGGAVSINTLPLNLYTGADGQAPDPTFTAGRGAPVPGYSGTCHVTATPMQLGSTPALPQISFQISGFFAHTAGLACPDDALPSLIVSDLLTNPRYGAGYPANNLADLGDFGGYCQSYQLGMSLLLDRQQQAARWLEEIAQLASAAIFFSGSLLRIVPYAENGVAQNGATWAPALSPVYSLGDNDYIEAPSDDPNQVTLTDQAQATNWLSVEYMPVIYQGNLENYNPQIWPEFDQAAIDAYGMRSEASIQAHEFTQLPAAQMSAKLMLGRKLHLRQKPITFKLPIKYCLLEPMDVVSLSDAYLGWAGKNVRLTSIAEDDNGELTVEAEELPGLPFPFLGAGQGGVGRTIVDPNVQPGGVNTPVIFEPPFALSGGATEVWIVATGEPPDWGGCLVWVSFDGASYANVGTILVGGRQGVLTAILPNTADPDTTSTLAIDLTECQGQMLSADPVETNAFITLCYVDGELVSYQDATLTSAYNYNLGTLLRRGVYGSPIGAHALDSQFARVSTTDNTVFRYAYPASFAGSTIFVKLTSFNLLGLQVEDVATVDPFAYVLSGAGIQPPVFLIAGSFAGRVSPGLTFIYVFVDPHSLPLNLAGSHGSAGISPSGGGQTFNIAKNGTNFGTMTFAANATTATFTATAQSFVAGDVLTLSSPTTNDPRIANVAWTLKGT